MPVDLAADVELQEMTTSSFPGVHAHLRDIQERAVLGQAENHLERVRVKLAEVKAEIRRCRCLPIPEQGRWLAAVVRGHHAYYAVPGNSDAVNAFRTQVIRHWRKALRHCSQRIRLTWARMNRIAA